MASGTVVSRVNYLKKLPLYQQEKPFQLFVPIDSGNTDQRVTNLEFEAQEATFHDVGECDDGMQSYTLDNHGVRIVKSPTMLDLPSFRDRNMVETIYFKEIEHILKTIEGGYDRIYIFDWRLRDSATPLSSQEFDMNDLTTWLRPSPAAHVDQSDRAVLHRIQLLLPDDALFLLQGRVRVINVWRPLEYAVEDQPLAFCEPASVPDESLVECDHVRRRFKGESLYAYQHDAHKWCYKGNHQPDEALLLKMFDSDATVAARRVLHASFRHPAATEKSRPRKSIEVRALVFNYETSAHHLDKTPS